jgi:hypothetical protein
MGVVRGQKKVPAKKGGERSAGQKVFLETVGEREK